MDLVELPDHQLDRRHPWEEARFQFFAGVLARSIDLSAIRAVLDVGAGDAWFAGRLTAHASIKQIVCWDTGYTPEFLAARGPAGGSRVRLVVLRPEIRFELLLLLDVLEHVADDAGFLMTLVRENMTPDGWVLISVPAWPSLFSSHDVRLRHHRRYTPDAARRLLAAAGLEIIYSAGLFHSLVLPRVLQVARERLTGKAAPPADLGKWNASAGATAVVHRLLATDAWLSRLESRLGWSLPGLSWWALCRARATRLE